MGTRRCSGLSLLLVVEPDLVQPRVVERVKLVVVVVRDWRRLAGLLAQLRGGSWEAEDVSETERASERGGRMGAPAGPR